MSLVSQFTMVTYLCPSLPVEHRPPTTPRHRILFWAALAIPAQSVPCCFYYDNTMSLCFKFVTVKQVQMSLMFQSIGVLAKRFYLPTCTCLLPSLVFQFITAIQKTNDPGVPICHSMMETDDAKALVNSDDANTNVSSVPQSTVVAQRQMNLVPGLPQSH